MAGPISVDRITNANIYIDGVGMLGRAEEVEVAWPKAKMADHKGLGMAGTAEFPAGIGKLEAKLKWISLCPEVLSAMSIFASHQLQVRASKETYTSQGRTLEVPVVLLMTAQFKDGGRSISSSMSKWTFRPRSSFIIANTMWAACSIYCTTCCRISLS
jgi:uncharacterized protein